MGRCVIAWVNGYCYPPISSPKMKEKLTTLNLQPQRLKATFEHSVLQCLFLFFFLVFSESTSIVRTFPLQDSITTWQFTGISLSKTHGEDLVISGLES